jgi:hypothetical protein
MESAVDNQVSSILTENQFILLSQITVGHWPNYKVNIYYQAQFK